MFCFYQGPLYMYLWKLTVVCIQGLSGSKDFKGQPQIYLLLFYVDLSRFDRQARGKVIEDQAIVFKQCYSVYLLKTKNNSKTK